MSPKRKHTEVRKTVSGGKRLDFQGDYNQIFFVWQFIEGVLVSALDFEMFRYCRKNDLIEADIIQQIDGQLKSKGEKSASKDPNSSVHVEVTVYCDMEYEGVIRKAFEESDLVRWVALDKVLILKPKSEWKIPEEETFKGEMKALGDAFKRLFFGKERKKDGRSDGSSGQED